MNTSYYKYFEIRTSYSKKKLKFDGNEIKFKYTENMDY